MNKKTLLFRIQNLKQNLEFHKKKLNLISKKYPKKILQKANWNFKNIFYGSSIDEFGILWGFKTF